LLAAAALHASRKGTALGTEAVRRLVDLYEPETSERLFMLTAGEGSAETLAATGLPGRAVGLLADEVSLALVYQAADVFLSPSLADAGPMMVPEALLCGTPVVAFELGYARDLITDPAAGAVVPADNVEALAQGLRETLDRHGDQQACRQAALAFAADDVAAAYLELYGSLRVTGRG
jgi:glycosyltransferase involved in cell wall biosynthesis